MAESDSQASLAIDAAGAGGGEPEGREPWLRFAVIFGGLAIASELLYYFISLDSQVFKVYLGGIADISAAALNFFGSDVSVHGTRISNADFAVEVAEGCDAIEVCCLLAAAVIAFPLETKRKLRGLVLGVLWLQLLNVVRIITLFWIGGHFTAVFSTAHEVVWPGILIAITIVTWILWVRWETQPADSAEHAT